jgi:hypothetical protein
MVQGVLAARRRDFASHERAMRHVVAQMSVAVSSRAMLLALDAIGFDPELGLCPRAVALSQCAARRASSASSSCAAPR